ncbi:outer membrane protein assembly factor BamD [Winogradskyella bathintestinalis]|uniref:Outer membrane protein assembly factor BamD n=1 Tax=Winogradskyella bathintestinalis TaxID=3035208 RepID=A0ABT7ZYC3_9FLAO|nr:outer membrane protein assembly factor BamD [Winogradskyella bathintestinalis]MDN3494013.1 outer membrane protein assembly factor BamD [Winogradskyella bathintestinalis]
MKKGLYILLISMLLISCSKFQKTLKSEDTAAKFEMATELYDAGKYKKSFRLADQILQQYRGKPQAEKLTYIHAMCSYHLGDYYIASYHLDKFTDIYPKSNKAEEAAFLAAKGYYFNSPVYSKEQKETVEAIEKLQLFINAYPNSEYLEEANKLVKELDYKLEKKAFEIAKQYNLIRDYQASIKSFNNFLLEFPGSTLRGDAFYYRFVASYNLAVYSVEYLKEVRIKEANDYYQSLKKSYPNSEYLEDATIKKEFLQQELNTFNTKS